MCSLEKNQTPFFGVRNYRGVQTKNSVMYFFHFLTLLFWLSGMKWIPLCYLNYVKEQWRVNVCCNLMEPNKTVSRTVCCTSNKKNTASFLFLCLVPSQVLSLIGGTHLKEKCEITLEWEVPTCCRLVADWAVCCRHVVTWRHHANGSCSTLGAPGGGDLQFS